MANRFSVGDTLGAQLYSQVISNQTQRYLQEKALEEERQRREAERRRQEEQRKKASDHGAFGQTLQTIGQVGGAIVGGMYGGPSGAIAGSGLGSAGASTIMNLFPNVGGTEPSGDNPYYNKPSDMAKFSSTLNTGLQAYGMYSKAAAAQAKQDLMDEIKADMSRPRMIIDESARLAQSTDPNYFDYKNATASQISDRIKSLPSWQNATGLFGEQLVNDSAALSIANNTYDQISQSALAGLQFIQGLDNNQAKQQALQNWQNNYGQSRADLIPKYGLESMQQSVQSGMNKNTYDSQMGQLDMAIKQQQVAAGGQSQTINAQNIEKNEQTIAAGDLAAQEAKIKGQINLMTAAIKNTSLTGNEVGTNIWTAAEKAGVSEEMIQTFKVAEDSAKAEWQANKNATAIEKQGKLLKIYQDTLKDIPADDPSRKVLIDSMMSSLSTGNGANSLVPVETTKALLASTADYDAETTTDAIAEALEKDLNNIVIDSLGQGSKQLKKGEIASILYNLDEENVDKAINKVKIKKFGSLEKFNTYLDQMVADDPEALEPDETTNIFVEFFKSWGNSFNVSEEQLRLQDAVKRGGE
jgi:hypothetical protein